MTRALLPLALCFVAIPAPGVAAAPAIPAAFHGSFARTGGHCADGNAQMEGMLSVRGQGMTWGEVVMDAAAVRRVSAVRIGVDSRNDAELGEAWTSTVLLTLSQRGQRLVLEQTRRNGRLLARRIVETYRRCP